MAAFPIILQVSQASYCRTGRISTDRVSKAVIR